MAEDVKSSFPWTAFLNPGAQLLTSAGNALYNWLAGGQEQRWQSEQARIAYERQLELLNNQREYDSPRNQLQRIIDAGLNPNLVYGQLDMSSSSPVTAPQAGAGSISPANMNINASDPLQSQLMMAQIERLKTQNSNDTRLTTSQIERFAALNGLSVKQSYLIEQQAEEAIARTSQLNTSLDNIKKQYEILSEQQKQEAFQTAYIESIQTSRIQATNEENRAIMEYSVALAAAELLGIKASTALKWAQTANTNKDTQLKQSQIRLNNAQEAVARNNAQYLLSLTSYTDANKEALMSKTVQTALYNYDVLGIGKDWNKMNFIEKFIQSLLQSGHMLTSLLGNVVHIGL